MADLEVVRWVHKPDGSRIPVKRDQFGSDLLIMNATQLIFVQAKGGKAVIGGTLPAARRKFTAFIFPPMAQQWVVAWPPRARAPRIIAVVEPPRSRRKDRLF